MRLRVAVDWDGVTVEDLIHDRRSLVIGAGEHAQVSLPGPPGCYVQIQAYRALAVLEVPVALVSTVRWNDGESEALLADRSITLSSQTGTCELTLRESFLSERPARVRITALESLPLRRDVALTGWAAAAVLLGTYLAAGIAYTHGVEDDALAAPKSVMGEERRDHFVTWIVDPTLPLEDATRSPTDDALARDDDDLASDYARLLVRGFERYVKDDLSGAQRAWSDAVTLVPERPEAFINLAQVAKRRHSLGEAEALLRQALSISPERCEALADLGLLEAERGLTDLGKQTLAHARTACGDRIGFVSLHLAALLGDAGELAQAQAELGRAIDALVGDTPDKRREALYDLEHQALFARLRTAATFPLAVARLRASLQRPI